MSDRFIARKNKDLEKHINNKNLWLLRISGNSFEICKRDQIEDFLPSEIFKCKTEAQLKSKSRQMTHVLQPKI